MKNKENALFASRNMLPLNPTANTNSILAASCNGRETKALVHLVRNLSVKLSLKMKDKHFVRKVQRVNFLMKIRVKMNHFSKNVAKVKIDSP